MTLPQPTALMLRAFCFLCLFIVALPSVGAGRDPELKLGNLRALETPLDKYVAEPDPSYSWKVVDKRTTDGITVFTIDMVSQTWRKQPEVNHPEWRHRARLLPHP